MEKATKTAGIDVVGEEHMATVDNALQYLKEHHVGALSEADDRRILRKIDRHLLPMVSVSQQRVTGALRRRTQREDQRCLEPGRVLTVSCESRPASRWS